MRSWHLHQHLWVGSLVIFIVLLGVFPVNLVLFSSPEDSLHDEEVARLKGIGEQVQVPRLMKEITTFFPNSRFDSEQNSTKTSPEDLTKPNFAIGNQYGIGGGSYSVYDSFNWTGNPLLSTQNKIGGNLLPTEQETSITISTPQSYNSEYTYFNISKVTSVLDWRLREDNMGIQAAWQSTSSYEAVAMSFTIEEDYANISTVRVNYASENSPTGEIYLVNSSSGKPDIRSNNISSIETMIIGSGWKPYTFKDPILLEKGQTYYVVMNATFYDGTHYWWWRHNIDNEYEDNIGLVHRYVNGLGWTNSIDFEELPLQIQVLPVENVNGNFVNTTYSDPSSLEFSYNTTLDNTSLSSYTWFLSNDTETHKFTTNTSTIFTLNFIGNYTYSSNPISPEVTYSINNNTATSWNLTYSVAAINQTFQVENRHLHLIGIRSDWNATEIYWNDSTTAEYSNMENNDNITLDGDSANKYTNGSSVMYVNASTLAENTTWQVWFDAPNYLYDFNLSRGGSYLSSPYEANVTDTLNLNFRVNSTGGNISFWIEYYGQAIHNRTDFNPDEISFSDPWIINDNVSQVTDVNGTYDLQAFWNNSDTTKVGTFTRTLDVFVNTSMKVEETPAQIIVGQLFNITMYYNTTHNTSTCVNGAPINITTNFTASVYMDQLQDHGVYNASLDTTGQLKGTIGQINITTEMPWFVNWTETIYVDFVDPSFLNVNETDLLLQWRDNTTLRIYYNYSSSDPIPDANVTVAGKYATYSDGAYYFLFNSTDYNGVGFYQDILINANHSDYETQEVNITLTITPGETSISSISEGQPLVNITGGVNQAYSASSEDNVTISLRYYHTLTDETLNTSEPSIDSPTLEYFDPVNESNYNWTITFNVSTIGNFLINISFNSANYNSSTFTFNLTVNAASTTIISEIDETDIYWNDSYDFALVYQNFNFTENITSGVIWEINDTNKVEYSTLTGDKFWFRFAPSALPVQSHAITINFSHSLNYFELSTIEVIFNVISRPTNITGKNVTSGTVLINGTSTYYRNYSPNEYDNFSISLRYYDNITLQTIDVEKNNITVQAHSSIYVRYSEDGANNWTFIVNGSVLGTYLINITFSQVNYTSSTFTVILILQAANSSINNQSVDPGNYPLKITNRSAYYFWVNWTSQYGEPLNDSDGVDISYTIGNIGDIILYSTNPSTGNHTFLFYPTTTGPINATLTFLKTNYTAAIFKINVTSIENTSLLANTTVLVLEWRENTTLQIWFNDSTNSPIAGATISVDGDSENVTEVSGIYYYSLNTTKYSGTGFHSNLNVTAELLYYNNRTWYFDLSITKGNTLISAFTDGTTVFNDTLGISQIFANSSADEIEISLRYYHILTDETLNVIIEPTVDSELNFTTPNEEANFNWTVTINPNNTGVFLINFTFSLTNYKACMFIFRLTVQKAGTAIYTSLPDGKEINYSTTFDFYLLYNNTDYNENITGLGEGSGITLNNSNIGFLNHSGLFDEIYWFRLNPSSLSVGSYSTEITFTHLNFNTSLIILNFTVIASGTTINATDYLNGTILLNGTSTYYRNYSPNEYDNFSIWLRYKEIIWQTTVDVDTTNITIEKNSTIQVNYWENISTHNWTFIFNGSALGTFIINITFSHFNHIDCTFTIIYVIQEADTKIGNQGIAPAPSKTDVISGNTFDFWLVWQSQYNENLNDSDGVEGNGTATDIVLLTTDLGTGNHTFRFTAPDIGIYTYNLTFVTVNYTQAVFLVCFNVTRRGLVLVSPPSSTYDNNSVGINVKYDNTIEFNIFLKDEGWESPVNIPLSNIILPTNISFLGSGPVGNHTFDYYAGQYGLGSSLAIVFMADNYFNLTYVISFNVYSRTMIFDPNRSTKTSPATVNLHYGDIYYFYIFINDSETKEPLDVPDHIVTPGNNNISFCNATNGFHLFYYVAWYFGTTNLFTISFTKENYASNDYLITFVIIAADSELITPSSLITTYYTINTDFFIVWQSIPNPQVNTSPQLRINTTDITIQASPSEWSDNIISQGGINGNYTFLIVANQSGTFTITLTLRSPFFTDIINREFTIDILPVPTVLKYSSLANNSKIGQVSPFYYSEQYTISITWFEIINDSGIRTTTPTYSGNGSMFASLTTSFVNGTHLFSIDANTLGTYQAVITLGITNYVELRYVVAFTVSKVPTFLHQDSTTNGTFIGEFPLFNYSETHTISVIWLENLTLSGIECTNPSIDGNGTSSISLNPVITDGNHLFTIKADVLGFYQASITLSIPNYYDLRYVVFFNVSIMCTSDLIKENMTFSQSILVEDLLHISGNETFKTFRNESIPLNNLSILMWMNSTLVSDDALDFNASQSWFTINFTTVGYQYGTYNLTLQLRKYGYQNQSIALWISLIGYEITIEVIIRPENIEQGEAIEIDVILSYVGGTGAGRGAGVTQASLEGVDVSFYIELLNEDDSTSIFEETLQTDALGQVTYTLDGSFTSSAASINNITVSSSASLSGLPSSFSVPLDILQNFRIEKPFINRLLDLLIPIAIVGGSIAVFVIIVGGSAVVLNRRRKRRQSIIFRHDESVEQSFEDIKSIRLIIARHQSGLQFYAEKTIADVQTDTDALSGMTTALSTFMKELSEGMSPSTEDHEQDEIEVMSREGLHMLVWHGILSSVIIISEISLPDYFQDRLKYLGQELESKFKPDLEDFYSADQIPPNQVKKIVRNFIPLHYFSAFVLNEGVLTLESIKLSKKDEKMLKLIKQVKMEKEGMHYFFAEQIISHLARHYKRSEAIEFLDRSIEINLLVEMTQEDLLQIGK